MERKTQRGMDDSLRRRISHCARRQRCLHGLFSTVSSNGCVCAPCEEVQCPQSTWHVPPMLRVFRQRLQQC